VHVASGWLRQVIRRQGATALLRFPSFLQWSGRSVRLAFRALNCFNQVIETGVLRRSGAEEYPRTRSG
jgi:hypothetical protein